MLSHNELQYGTVAAWPGMTHLYHAHDTVQCGFLRFANSIRERSIIHVAFAGKLIEKAAGLGRHDRTLLLALRAQSGPVRFEIGLTPTV